MLQLYFTATTIVSLLVVVSTESILLPQAKSGCQEKCGDLVIPFPFGIGENCSMQPEFNITCEESTTPKLSNGTYTFPSTISDFSLVTGELKVMQDAALHCYDEEGNNRSTEIVLDLPPSYTISARNYFFIIGCNVLAVYSAGAETGVSAAFCLPIDIANLTKSCTGIGCSQISIPIGVQNISIALAALNDFNASDLWQSKYPCSYAFIVEEENFMFDPNSSFEQLKTTKKQQQVAVEWAVGDQSCEKAMPTLCKGNSSCINRSSITKGMTGYICQCNAGYGGNPYLGCQDIDECTTEKCVDGSCINKQGNYTCACDEGFINIDHWTCKPDKSPNNTSLKISLGIIIGFLVLVVSMSCIYWKMNKRRIVILKQKRFKENGGETLRQQLVNHGGSIDTARIFKEDELLKATNNYHGDEILGEGGYGTVYKGILHDKTVVAIKKPKSGAPTSQSDQFVNEVIVLSQINHRNVVKLLGCCCETEAPILVYEYVTHGTLYQHLFVNGKAGYPLSWELRLKIASETAGALAYLHSSASTPIIHRDVKTTNILLDENYIAKVSDFGASRFIPLDQTELATLVQGTLGYLDPEYFHSNQLTEKSDVYSFGVVLAELLTSKVALSFARPDKERCLASFFVSSIENGCLIQILDADIVNEGNIETVEQVAKLAKRCMMIKGDERPTMREVAMELEGMRVMAKQAWKNGNSGLEESEYLLGTPFDSATSSVVNIGSRGDGASSSVTNTGYDSMHIQTLIPYDDGR